MKNFLACVLLATLALAAGCNSSGRPQNSTDLRGVNAVVDAEPLDVYVANDVKFPGLAPNSSSPFVNFDSGSKALTVKSSTTQAVLYDNSLNFASVRESLLLYGTRASMQASLLPEDILAPSSGHARVRAVGLAANAGAVDVYLTQTDLAGAGAAVVTSVGFGAVTTSTEVVTGSYKVIVTVAGSQEVLFQSPTAQALEERSSVTVAIMPSIGGRLVNAMLLVAGQSGTTTYIANPVARLRTVNGIPDAAGANFKVDGSVFSSGVSYATATAYAPAATGSHQIQVESAAVPGSALATLTATLDAARDYTLVALGTPAATSFALLPDDNAFPAVNFSRVRFVNALAAGTAVDVSVGGTSQATNIARGAASGYSSIAVGTGLNVTFTAAGTSTVVGSLDGVQLDSQNVYTVFLFGSANGTSVVLVKDR